MTLALPSRIALKNLRELNKYLGTYSPNQRAAAFENIVSMSFADILNLPFYTAVTDDQTIQRKVVWNGSLSPLIKAPPGPDCTVHSRGYNCVVESTMREGAGQWTVEGAQLVRHTTDAVTKFGWTPTNVYSILVTTKIAHDSFFNFHTNPGGLRIVLLESEQLVSVLETAVLAVNMRTMELRELMQEAIECLRQYPSIRSYKIQLDKSISSWRQRVLESEKWVVVGLNALRAMKAMSRNPPFGLGELYRKLSQNKWMTHYLTEINQSLTLEIIEESLDKQGFACCRAGINDTLIYPVMMEDFIDRGSRIHKRVKSVGFQ